jgi:hypothetical protein
MSGSRLTKFQSSTGPHESTNQIAEFTLIQSENEGTKLQHQAASEAAGMECRTFYRSRRLSVCSSSAPPPTAARGRTSHQRRMNETSTAKHFSFIRLNVIDRCNLNVNLLKVKYQLKWLKSVNFVRCQVGRKLRE